MDVRALKLGHMIAEIKRNSNPKRSEKIGGGAKSARVGKSPKLATAARAAANSVQNAPKKKSGWSKFLDGFKKALGIGGKLAEFVLPLLGTTGPGGVLGTVNSCGRSGRRMGISKVPDAVLAQSFSMSGMGMPHVQTLKDGYRMVHSGLLAPVNIPANAKKGDMIYRINLSPTVVEQWLAKMANFEKFAFEHIVVTYKPVCAATEEGAILGWFEWDVDDPLVLGQGEDSIRDAMAHESAQMGSVWQPMSWHFTNEDEPAEMWYVDQTGQEARFTDQGMFSLCTAMDNGEAEFACGELLIAYSIKFQVPELRSSNTGTWGYYYGDGTGEAATPFGSALTRFDTIYEDPFNGDETVPQNAQMIMHVVGGEYLLQLPRGFWCVMMNFNGCTGLAGTSLKVFGDYDFLVDPIGGDHAYYVFQATQGVAYALIYSSGWNVNWNTATDLPANGFNITFTDMTTDGNAYVGCCYLNGCPKSTLPQATGTMLKRMMKRLEKLEREKSELTITPESIRAMLANGDGSSSSGGFFKLKR
jgi:hypothetical protein